MTVLDALELIPVIASIVSVIAAACLWTYKRGIKPLIDWGHKMSAAAKEIADNTVITKELEVKVDSIQNELKYNSGGSLRDIVSQIHARVVLSQQFDRALADGLPYAIWHADANGDFLWSNRMWEKYTGMPPERTRAKGWIFGIHPEDRDHVVTEWYRAARDHREFVLTFRLQDADGAITMINAQAFMMKDEKDRPLGYVGSATTVEPKPE